MPDTASLPRGTRRTPLLVLFALSFLLLPGGSAQSLSDMSWDDIVTQAKAEGEVTWYVWYLQDDLRRAVRAFEEEYGIRVRIPEGTNAGNADKPFAESGRPVGDIDVFG